MTVTSAEFLVLLVLAVGSVVCLLYEFVALPTGLPTISTIIRAAVEHFAAGRRAVARGDARRTARASRRG